MAKMILTDFTHTIHWKLPDSPEDVQPGFQEIWIFVELKRILKDVGDLIS